MNDLEQRQQETESSISEVYAQISALPKLEDIEKAVGVACTRVAEKLLNTPNSIDAESKVSAQPEEYYELESKEPETRRDKKVAHLRKRHNRFSTPSPDRAPTPKKNSKSLNHQVMVRLPSDKTVVLQIGYGEKVMTILSALYRQEGLHDGKLLYQGKPVEWNVLIMDLEQNPSFEYTFQLPGGNPRSKSTKREENKKKHPQTPNDSQQLIEDFFKPSAKESRLIPDPEEDNPDNFVIVEDEATPHELEEKQDSDYEENLPEDWHPEYSIESNFQPTETKISAKVLSTIPNAKKKSNRSRRKCRTAQSRQRTLVEFLDLTQPINAEPEAKQIEQAPLKIISWNANGMSQQKLDEISWFAEERLAHLICLSEIGE